MRVVIKGKGVLQGTILTDAITKTPKCHRFSRVPYALPPIGSRRWCKPEPLPLTFTYGSENKPGKYTTASSICPQPSVMGPSVEGMSEDCLHLNIWVPLGKPPGKGWPVFFYIHGGFLQMGSNNWDDPSSLISETDVKCIIVSPGYRLGVFGFLSSREICSSGSSPPANFGFWDQRLALEWTYDHIQDFGGDKDNITVGGYSAGSFATFHQLAHDIGPNSKRQIVRRVFQWSNGCGVQPKKLPEVQGQFEELLDVLKIPKNLRSSEKLDALRLKTSEELVTAVSSLKQKFFRPILDGEFISNDLFPNLFSGKFGARMKELGIQTMLGDLTQEHYVYSNIYPPNSFESLADRLSWDYPRHVAEAVCQPFKPASTTPPRSAEEWKDIFGRLYADMQVHSTMRGFLNSISSKLPLSHIHRYRIDWRTQSVDKMFAKSFGATHSSDLSIWFYGNGSSLTAEEKLLVGEWLKPVGQFLRGEKVEWGTKDLKEVRVITAEGKIEVKKDEIWDFKLPLWLLTKEVTKVVAEPKI